MFDWQMWDWGEILFKAFCVFVALLVVYWILGFAMLQGAQAACVAHGYPHYSLTWDLQQYCWRVVEQTEHLVPLTSLP